MITIRSLPALLLASHALAQHAHHDVSPCAEQCVAKALTQSQTKCPPTDEACLRGDSEFITAFVGCVTQSCGQEGLDKLADRFEGGEEQASSAMDHIHHSTMSMSMEPTSTAQATITSTAEASISANGTLPSNSTSTSPWRPSSTTALSSASSAPVSTSAGASHPGKGSSSAFAPSASTLAPSSGLPSSTAPIRGPSSSVNATSDASPRAQLASDILTVGLTAAAGALALF